MTTVNDLAGLSYRSPVSNITPHQFNKNNYQESLTPQSKGALAQFVDTNLRFSGNEDGDVFVKSSNVEPKESVDNKRGFFYWLFKDYKADEHTFI